VARHCGSNNGSAAIIKLMQSSYPTSQAFTTARERGKCFCMGFPNLHVAAYLHLSGGGWSVADLLFTCRGGFRGSLVRTCWLAHYTICRSTNLIHNNRGPPWRTARLVNS
jgi:hypothetical protein